MNVVEEKRSSVVMWLMVSKDLGEKSSRRRTQKELSLPGLDGVPCPSLKFNIWRFLFDRRSDLLEF